MKKTLICAILSIVGFHTVEIKAQENVIDEVLWVVGDEAILKSQVEELRKQMLYEGEKINGDPYCVIPEQIAIQKLFLHQAKIDSITFPESQVIQQVDMRMNYFISQLGSKEKMEEYFNKPYSQLREDMKDMVRDQGIIEEMQQKIVGDIKVTPATVRKYFSSLSADSIPYIPEQVEVQIITMDPKVPRGEIDRIKERLREFTERVNSGDSEFSTLAVLYSEDVESAKQGGELGFMGKGQLVPEFASVAFNLQDPKKVSKIVETEFGFHIIQLIERRGDRVNVRHILLRPHVSEADKRSTAVKMDSLWNDLSQKKFSFEEAAMYVSSDKDTRNNGGLMVNKNSASSKFEMQQLPQDVAKEVSTMKVGDLSKPFFMVTESKKELCAIIKLKARTEGHKANISDDYMEIKGMVEGKMRHDLIQKWIKKKQAETYVRIKTGYQNCDFQYPGWVKSEQ